MPKKRMALSAAARRPGRPWPSATLDIDDPRRTLKVALAISIALHAVALSVKFRFPEMVLNKARESQLEVILVNSKTAAKPAEPQARAQANLDAGGNTDENRRAKTPLPAAREQLVGTELLESRQRAHESEASQPKLLAKTESQRSMPEESQKVEQPERASPMDGADLAQTALAMARMEAQISRQFEEYNKRPRKKFVGARVTEAVEAQYVEDWRQKVERVGNLNYPDTARGKLYGSLVLTVGIRADGELESIEINRPSGYQVLDEAARRIVRLAAPYGTFPAALRRNVDILVITRTWTFTSSDRLQSD